jgi:anthranilate synthase
MGIRHRELPIEAVQFHPESILTLDGNCGLRLIENVVAQASASRAANPA